MSDANQTDHDTSHDNHAHGSYKSYIIGFVFSVILTVIPFWIVMSGGTVSVPVALGVIFSLGAIQIVVHIHYFLHVTLKVEEGWQVMSLVFTAIILVIVLAGSIWVMFHLHENMMPDHDLLERFKRVPLEKDDGH